MLTTATILGALGLVMAFGAVRLAAALALVAAVWPVTAWT
jgi:hypothetical protein